MIEQSIELFENRISRKVRRRRRSPVSSAFWNAVRILHFQL